MFSIILHDFDSIFGPVELIQNGFSAGQYYSGKNDYLPVFFFFEGLITEFVEITYRFPSLRASFSSQVRNV